MIFDFMAGMTGAPLPDEYHSTHWNDLFHRLHRTDPVLFNEMHALIEQDITSPRYDWHQPTPPTEIPNSSWLGDQLFAVFPHLPDWMAFCRGSHDASRGLFGQMMWNVMALDGRDWFTIVTGNANPERLETERVYWRRGAPHAVRP